MAAVKVVKTTTYTVRIDYSQGAMERLDVTCRDRYAVFGHVAALVKRSHRARRGYRDILAMTIER